MQNIQNVNLLSKDTTHANFEPKPSSRFWMRTLWILNCHVARNQIPRSNLSRRLPTTHCQMLKLSISRWINLFDTLAKLHNNSTSQTLLPFESRSHTFEFELSQLCHSARASNSTGNAHLNLKIEWAIKANSNPSVEPTHVNSNWLLVKFLTHTMSLPHSLLTLRIAGPRGRLNNSEPD